MLPILNAESSRSVRVTMSNILDEEFKFITSQYNLNLWASLSIEERCVIFHRTFPNRRIKKGIMLKVMKLSGLRIKKIEISNVPAKRETRV
jgi:hypothetical protein